MIGLNDPVLQLDGKYEFFVDFLKKGEQRSEIRCNIQHKCCPAEIRLDSDNFEGAGLRYSEKWVKALRKHFGGFEFVGFVIQEADSEEDVAERL